MVQALTLERATAAVGIVAALAYAPWWHDLSVAPKLAVVSAGLPALLMLARPVYSLGHSLLLAWIGYGTLTLLWTPDFWGGVAGLWLLALFTMAYWIGGALSETRAVIRALAIGVAASGVLVVIEQLTQFRLLSVTLNSGLFSNKNFLAEAGAVLIVWTVVQREFLLALALTPTIWFTTSRGAVAAIGAAVIVALWPRFKFGAAAAALAGAGLLLNSWDHATASRLEYWKLAMLDFTPFGHGLGAFYPNFPALYPALPVHLSRPEFPHNEMVNWFYTLGLGSAIPLAFSIWLWRGAGAGPFRPVLAACAVVAFFGFPLQLPFSVMLFGLVAGIAAGAGGGLCHTVEPRRNHLQHCAEAK